jgi:hypothetical protein
MGPQPVRQSAIDRYLFVESKEGGRYGYVNRTGRVVIPARFEYADAFDGDFAYARELGGAGGLIDTSGRLTFAIAQCPEGYRCDDPSAEEIRQGAILFESVDLGAGYMEPGGKVAIQPDFRAASRFSENLAWVAKEQFPGSGDWQWFCIDTTGRQRFPVFFRQVLPYAEGRAAVQAQTGGWFHIDSQGKPLSEERWDYANSFREGLAYVRGRSFHGYLNVSGARQITLPPEVEYARSFSNGMACFRISAGGRAGTGYIDRTGEFAVKPLEGDGGDFAEGLARFVRTADSGRQIRDGFIDKVGRYVCELPPCTGVGCFQGGLCPVALKKGNQEEVVYVDRQGRVALRPPQGCRLVMMFPGRD